MSSHNITPSRGSDRAPALHHALVEDVMHPGILSCGPEDDLATVARTMADNHVHAVVVSGIEPTSSGGERLTWGMITALDLTTATLAGDASDAGELASTEIVTVEPADRLERAAQLMSEHQLTHLMVVAGARPVGIVSTLDVAASIAGSEA
jgi:crotonyl-CoA carboxylase/reductase